MFSLRVIFTMEVSDASLVSNRDWDPSYLQDIFDGDFHEFTELWSRFF